MTEFSRFKYAQVGLSASTRAGRTGKAGCAIGGMLAAGSLQAATITVTTLEDDFIPNECSLRAAIASANSNSPINACEAGSAVDADQVVFEPDLAGALQLAAGLPVKNFWDGSQLRIDESVEIVGPVDAAGDNAVTIVGTGAAPVVYITSPADRVQLQRLTISGGYSPAEPPVRRGYGGGVLSYGRELELVDTVITGNSSARAGGGVWHQPGVEDGRLTALYCEFSENSTALAIDGSGGGMAVRNSVVSVSGCVFSDNQAGGPDSDGSGGALSIQASDPAEVILSEFYSNSAFGGQGGALHVQAAESQVYLAVNRFEFNQADIQGGGLSIQDLTPPGQEPFELGMVKNDFFSNESSGPGGGFYLSSGPGEVSIFEARLTDNSAVASGGGAAIRLDGSSLDWEGGLVTDNRVQGFGSGGGGLLVLSSGGNIEFDSVGLIRNDSGPGCGGGLALSSLGGNNGPDSIVVENSVIFDNVGYCGGGADLFFPASGSLEILMANNEWSSNQAMEQNGGAVFFSGDHDSLLVMSNSTISGNAAAESGAGVFAGGSGTLSVKYSTLAENAAESDGHNIASNAGDCVVRNTILAGSEAANVAGSTACLLNYSLLENSDGSAFSVGDGVLLNDAPRLGPLDDNGETFRMLTHAPEPGSPVIDAGNASVSVPIYDQRGKGFPRIQGAALDMGALETGAELTDRIFTDRFEDGN